MPTKIIKKVPIPEQKQVATLHTPQNSEYGYEISPEQLKELAKLVNDLNKKFGNNSVSKGVPKSTALLDFDRIPTGSISLDIALGGGIPVGRYTEISGGYSTTKTTQSLHILREAQKLGLICAFIDVEETTNEDYFRQIGVDYNNLLYSNPDSTEEATQMILDMQRSGIINFAILDSIAALSPNAEIKTDMDVNTRMAAHPQLINEFMRKYTGSNNRLKREGKKPFTLICLNQLRDSMTQYGETEYSPGGKQKGHTATVDLRFRRGDWITEGSGENKEVVGQVVKFKVYKNKLGKRMSYGEFDFYFSENSAGIKEAFNDVYKEIILSAVEWNVVNRGGAWFSYEGQKWQGQEALVNALRNDPELVEKLKSQVLFLSSRKG